MNIFKIKNKNFFYEHILDSKNNKQIIKNFKVSHINAKGLEEFLKLSSEKDEIDKNNRTYIVKDKKTKELVAYFSLRTGLFTIGEKKDFVTIPSIELSNFAVNENYRNNHKESKYLGAVVFAEFVLPIVRYISDFIGVKALYIYALPEESLIHHYTTFGFARLEKVQEKFVHAQVKPGYDEGCIFMYQLL